MDHVQLTAILEHEEQAYLGVIKKTWKKEDAKGRRERRKLRRERRQREARLEMAELLGAV
jgi:hypothetical protein